MNIKTISTVSGVNTVDFGSSASRFYWFRNVGTTAVHVSGKADIVAGSDGVAELAAGDSVCIESLGGKVYVLGAGKVQIHNTGDKFCPFKIAPVAGGGSGGGEATVSNPNLLINPDFKINQRGSTEYSPARYTVDRWFNEAYTKVTVESDGITITAVQDINQEWWGVRQYIESVGQQYSNLPITVSAYISEFTGEWFIPTPTNSGNNRINITASGLNSMTFTGNYNRWFGIGAVNVKAGDYIKLKWMKVEIERSATQFVPPDTTIELLKCQRYYFALIGDETSISNSAVGIAANNTWLPIGFLFPTEMREIPTISISYLAKWNAATANENTICNSAYTSKNGIPVLSSSNHEFVAGELYYVRFSADAEIY